MASKRFFWLKLQEDFFQQKAMKKLRRMERGEALTIIYLKMQLASLRNGGVIAFEGLGDSLTEELSLQLDESENDVCATVEFLMKCGLMEQIESTDTYISIRRAGARVKELPRDIPQKELAKLAGVSCSTVSSACRGERVSLDTAGKIAAALGEDMKKLFTIESSKENLSPKTIRNYHSFVSSVLGYAVRMGMIRDNPARNVILPPLEHGEKECYTLEEAQRFLDSLGRAPTKYQAFFVLAIYGGFRRGELLGLEWKDIDFKDHIISIRRTSLYTKEKGIFTDTTKTARSQRTLKLPFAVFEVLKRHRAAQSEERLKLGDVWHGSDRLFVNWDGKPMHPNTPYHWLRGFCKETGQRFLGVHQFRHLNATLLITSGTDARTVSAALGHSQTSTTLNIYTHTFQEAQARAGEAVAAVLERSITKTG